MFATKDDSFEFQNFKTSGKQVIKHVITKVGSGVREQHLKEVFFHCMRSRDLDI